MYAQECYHYKRPDVSNVTWLTPQQMEAARVARSLAPIKVLEIKPIVRAATSHDSDDVKSLLAAAPTLFAQAMRSGLAVIRKDMPSQIINKGVRKFSLAHRAKLSLATKLQHQQNSK